MIAVKGVALDLSGLANLESMAKRRQVAVKAVKAAAKPVQQAAKSLAPKRQGSGALKQSIGIKAEKGSKGQTIAFAVVGPRKKVEKVITPPGSRKAKKVVPAYYAHLVEKGTRPHRVGKGSKLGRKGKADKLQTGKQHPGAKAKPWLLPAWNSTQTRSLAAGQAAFGSELQKQIAKEASRLARKAKGK